MKFHDRKKAYNKTRFLSTLELNITRNCNLACRHCHLSCGPTREESMSREIMDRALTLARRSGMTIVDITGGAPERHPDLPRLLEEAKDFTIHLRTNLTVLQEKDKEIYFDLFPRYGVTLFASLPFYKKSRTDRQRGEGVYENSLAVLRKLNAKGYGESLPLHLIYNPPGAILPGDQKALERIYREKLRSLGVVFTDLLTITNMPLGRFLDWLRASGNEDEYRALLEESYNEEAHEKVMCRSMIAVDVDGKLYDCDFNLALGLEAKTPSLWDREVFAPREIVTASHCYGCTAGAGSS